MLSHMKPRLDEPSDLDWSVVAALEAVAAAIHAGAAKDLRDEALTPGAMAMLDLVSFRPGSTASALASSLGISRQAASKAVQGLVEKGLLECKDHPDDARAQKIQVTAAGKKLMQRSRTRRGPSVAKMLQPLNPRERAVLLELLGKLRGEETAVQPEGEVEASGEQFVS